MSSRTAAQLGRCGRNRRRLPPAAAVGSAGAGAGAVVGAVAGLRLGGAAACPGAHRSGARRERARDGAGAALGPRRRGPGSWILRGSLGGRSAMGAGDATDPVTSDAVAASAPGAGRPSSCSSARRWGRGRRGRRGRGGRRSGRSAPRCGPCRGPESVTNRTASRRHGLGEARPAAAGVVLRVGAEQHRSHTMQR